MLYLIAKIALLLAIAAVFGFMFGRWWVRRSFVDVTESYETISKAATDTPWKQIVSKVDNIDDGIRTIVADEVAKIPVAEMPTVDLGPVALGIADLDARNQWYPYPTETGAREFR